MSTFNKPSITHESARSIIAKAKEEAAAIGIKVSVAVVDESGILKAFERMDGAALVTVASSQDKAYTAVGFGLASKSWYPMIEKDPALLFGVPAAMDRLVI